MRSAGLANGTNSPGCRFGEFKQANSGRAILPAVDIELTKDDDAFRLYATFYYAADIDLLRMLGDGSTYIDRSPRLAFLVAGHHSAEHVRNASQQLVQFGVDGVVGHGIIRAPVRGQT
jgi:hypothetical protein